MNEEQAIWARRELLAPLKGRTVQVVGGRKVPKGTKGVVFWVDAPTNPARLGIKDAHGATHWVDARWCEAVYADFPVGGAPACGWVAYRDALRAQEEAFKATLPKVKRGDTVTLATSGLTGTVFWVKDTRLGVGFGTAKDAAGNYVDKAWADLSEVVAVNGEIVTSPEPLTDLGGELDIVLEDGDGSGGGVSSGGDAPLPWPYSAIAKLNLEGGLYAAYDAEGGFLLQLDTEGVREVLCLMPHVNVTSDMGSLSR